MSENNVICIRWGTKYSPDYVQKLYDQTRPYKFICYTDQPERIEGVEYRPCFEGLEGWYQKLGLFKSGVIEGKSLFLDLDVIVAGELDRFFDWPHDFGISKDFIWQGFNSSVMILTPDVCPAIYDDYIKSPRIHRKGDQGIIEEYLPDAVTFPREWCLSYKVDHVHSRPENAIVVLHGLPNPPDCKDEWIKDFWP